MKIYIPKIIADSPTKLPPLEKTIFYYILDQAFKLQVDDSDSSNLQINTNTLLQVLNNTAIEFIDLKSQTSNAINNLTKIKLSLVDNDFHIKLAPIDSMYQVGGSLYLTLNPIVVDYFEQILDGNFVSIDLSLTKYTFSDK